MNVFRNPDDETLRALLTRVKTIALVGASPRPERPSHRIMMRLMQWGYRVIPVRPAISEVLGQKAYPRLADVPEKIDLVDVFRNPADVAPLMDECIALALPAVWLQEGVIDEEAAQRGLAAGLEVIMDRCILIEYRKLMT